ncbi:uncharacterized protein [Oscarella lobularis]
MQSHCAMQPVQAGAVIDSYGRPAAPAPYPSSYCYPSCAYGHSQVNSLSMGPTAHAIASESSPLALTVEPSNPSSKSRSHAGPILSGPRRSKRRTINTKEIKNEKQKVRDAKLRECEQEAFGKAKELLGTNFGSLELTKCEQLEFVKNALDCMTERRDQLSSREALIVNSFLRDVHEMVQHKVNDQITRKVRTETCRKVLPPAEWCGNCLTVARKKGCLKRGRDSPAM